jgi:hypothetical protein
MGKLMKSAALVALGGFLYNKYRSHEGNGSAVNMDSDVGPSGSSGVVRDAGPAHQADPVAADWDMVDQQSDESFPASDAPGNY